MSANNYLKINRKNFIVSDCDAESSCGLTVGKGEDLEGAINIAQKYQQENIVEYGIRLSGKAKVYGKNN